MFSFLKYVFIFEKKAFKRYKQILYEENSIPRQMVRSLLLLCKKASGKQVYFAFAK
jgi:hypothetical protein